RAQLLVGLHECRSRLRVSMRLVLRLTGLEQLSHFRAHIVLSLRQRGCEKQKDAERYPSLAQSPSVRREESSFAFFSTRPQVARKAKLRDAAIAVRERRATAA